MLILRGWTVDEGCLDVARSYFLETLCNGAGSGVIVKLRVLSHILVNFWTSLQYVKRGPYPKIGSVMGWMSTITTTTTHQITFLELQTAI